MGNPYLPVASKKSVQPVYQRSSTNGAADDGPVHLLQSEHTWDVAHWHTSHRGHDGDAMGKPGGE